jgi:hypothetical protein
MFRLPAASRLEAWRNFRKSLDTLEFESALQQTAEFWTPAPYTPYYLDPDDVESWPDPWTLVEENYYCDLAKALGIVYTIQLSEHQFELDIRVYKDPSTMEPHNLVFVDNGKYVLNYIHDEVVNKEQIDKDLKLVKIISSEQLGLNKLQ